MSDGYSDSSELFRALSLGSHICHFYHRQEDLYEGVTAFIREGLHTGDYCFLVAAPPLDKRTLVQRWMAELDEWEEAVQSGRIRVEESRTWYFDEDGAFRPVEDLIAKTAKTLEEIAAAGYDRIRASGHIGLLAAREWEAYLEYETRVDELAKQAPVMVYCAQSLTRCPLTHLKHVMRPHDLSFFQKGDRWEVLA